MKRQELVDLLKRLEYSEYHWDRGNYCLFCNVDQEGQIDRHPYFYFPREGCHLKGCGMAVAIGAPQYSDEEIAREKDIYYRERYSCRLFNIWQDIVHVWA